jgi:excisionase family DNA binding protein
MADILSKGGFPMTKKTITIRSYPDLLTVKDIQDILHIGRSTAYSLLKSGEVKAMRIGSIYRIPKVNLQDYIIRNS